jgi:hypothetical protein
VGEESANEWLGSVAFGDIWIKSAGCSAPCNIVVIPAEAGIQFFLKSPSAMVKSYLRVAPPLRPGFLSLLVQRKEPKKARPPHGATSPCASRLGLAVAQQHFLVLAGDQRDPSRCLSGARPEAYDARARHTGFELHLAFPDYCSAVLRALSDRSILFGYTVL